MDITLPPLLKRVLKRVGLVLGLLTLVFGVLAGLLLTFGFQTEPHQIEASKAEKSRLAQEIVHAKLLPRTLQGEAMQMALPLPALNATLDDLAHHATGGRATLHTAPNQLQFFMSIPTARTPLRRLLPNAWINLRGRWQVAPRGRLILTQAQWGQLPLPVTAVNWVFDGMLHHYNLREFVAIAMQCIQQVQVSSERVNVRWQWRADLRARTFAALIPASELGRIHVYQEALVQQIEAAAVPVASQHNGYLPLLTIMQPLFKLAQQRTLAQQLNTQAQVPPDQLPIYENRAALLVMAMHAMRIDLSALIPQAKDWPGALPYPFTLRDRVDFAQHYLLSALIASGVGGRVADLIGVYKEQVDKVSGSGFSFNDIAADRAGIRFGQRARLTAQQLQVRVQEGEDEDFFMPNVDDMPQFLDAGEFHNRFGGINHGAYNETLSLIDQRVDRLGVLR